MRFQGRNPQALSYLKKKELANARGFTLIETTIALLVMMVAGLGAVSLFAYSMNNNSGGGERALAMAVAQQQLEQLRSVSFNDARLNQTAVSGTTLVPDIVSAGRSYRVVRTVQDLNGGTLKDITIQVRPLGASTRWAATPVILRTQRSAVTMGAN